MTPPAEEVAWAWVAHLRSGGSRHWRDWRAAPDPVAPPLGPGPLTRLPGAAQLEVARRLAALAPAPDDRLAALVDRALTRTGPGRGLPELPLPLDPPDPDPAGPVVGPRPVDPDDVPPEELARVATGLVASCLVERTATEQAPSEEAVAGRPSRRLLRPRRFVVAGAPIRAAALRGALLEAGHREGGRRPTVLVLAPPLDRGLLEVWSARVQHSAAATWPGLVRRWARRDAVPPTLDALALARRWRDRVGTDRVHVVVGDPWAGAEEALRLGSRPAAATPCPDERRLSPAEVDAVRRVNRVLWVKVSPDRADTARGLLLSTVAARRATVRTRLRVPAEHREWLEGRAARMREGLTADGYAVHGDLAGIAPRHRGPDRPRPERVLDTLLAAALDLAAPDGDGRGTSKGSR